MDIEAVKVNLAKAQQYCRGNWTQLHVLPAVLIDLPDAIELIEEMEDLLCQVSMESDHVDCDGPGCWWCGAECGTPHAKSCAVDAVLAKIRLAVPMYIGMSDATDGKMQSDGQPSASRDGA